MNMNIPPNSGRTTPPPPSPESQRARSAAGPSASSDSGQLPVQGCSNSAEEPVTTTSSSNQIGPEPPTVHFEPTYREDGVARLNLIAKTLYSNRKALQAEEHPELEMSEPQKRTRTASDPIFPKPEPEPEPEPELPGASTLGTAGKIKFEKK